MLSGGFSKDYSFHKACTKWNSDIRVIQWTMNIRGHWLIWSDIPWHESDRQESRWSNDWEVTKLGLSQQVRILQDTPVTSVGEEFRLTHRNNSWNINNKNILSYVSIMNYLEKQKVNVCHHHICGCLELKVLGQILPKFLYCSPPSLCLDKLDKLRSHSTDII